MTLLRAAKLNALASYANFFVSSVVTLIVSPLLVTYLGSAGFGTWKAIQKLMDFGTVADGRAMQALKWVIARNAGKQQPLENRKAVGSAVLVWLMFLPMTVLVAAAILWLMPQLISDAALDPQPLRLIGGLFALNLVLMPLLGIPDAVLVGSNKGYASMMMQTCTLVAANAGMVCAAAAGFGLTGMALVMLAATLVSAALVFIRSRGLVDWFGIAKPEEGSTRRFFRFSGWVLVWSLVSKLLLSGEVVLLGALVGATAVTDYTFTAYAPQFAIAICFMTGSAAMPGIGSLIAETDRSKLVTAVNACRNVVLALAVLMCSGILLFNRLFVGVWVGEAHFLGDTINILLVLSAFQLILIRNEAQIQDLTLSIRSKVILGVFSSLLSLALGLVFYRMSGGQPWTIFAGIIAARLMLTVAFPRLVDRMAPGLSRDWKNVTLATAIVLGVGAASMLLTRLTLIPGLLAAALIFALASWLSTYQLLDSQARNAVIGVILRRGQR